MEHITKSAKETQKLGEDLGAGLKGGETIALCGELGAGKTTFVQGLARGLGVDGRIISPTFMIMRKYGARGGLSFYHIDFYRLEGDLGLEIDNLGLSDIWGRKENVVVIEWAEKIRDLLPANTRWVNFEYLGEGERRIVVDEGEI